MNDKILNQVALSAVYQARAARLHKKPVLGLFPHEDDPMYHMSKTMARFSVLSALCHDQITAVISGDFSDYTGYVNRVDNPFGEWYGRYLRNTNEGESDPQKKLAELILNYFDASLPPELQSKVEAITNKYLGYPFTPLEWVPSLYRQDGTELGMSELWVTSMDGLPPAGKEFFVYVLTAKKPDETHISLTIGGHVTYVQVKLVIEGVAMHPATEAIGMKWEEVRTKLETMLAMPLADLISVSSILKSEWRDCISFQNAEYGDDIAPVWNSGEIYRKTGDISAVTNRGGGVTVGVSNNFLGVKRLKFDGKTSYEVGINKDGFLTGFSPMEEPVPYLPQSDEAGKQKSLENETQKVREDLASGPLGTPVAEKQTWLASLQPFGKMDKVLRVFSSPAGMSMEEKFDALNDAYNKHGKEVVTITEIDSMTRAMLCASLSHPLFIDFS